MSQVVEQEKPAGAQVAHYAAEFQRASAQAPAQPRWLSQARESAMTRFEGLGFPTTRHEQWRFTSVAPIAERPFTLASHGKGVVHLQSTAPLSAPLAQAVCVNGSFLPHLSFTNE